jgi:hypothetical protein
MRVTCSQSNIDSHECQNCKHVKPHDYEPNVCNRACPYVYGANCLPSSADTLKKPPIGVMPHSIWLNKRKEDLLQAIRRFIEANKTPNEEWVLELAWLEDLRELNYPSRACEHTHTFEVMIPINGGEFITLHGCKLCKQVLFMEK